MKRDFEIRLSPLNSAEKRVADLLDSMKKNYGGKNTVLRDCIYRGYELFVQALKESESKDAVEVLDSLTRKSNVAHEGYGFRGVGVAARVPRRERGQAITRTEPLAPLDESAALPSAADPSETLTAAASLALTETAEQAAGESSAEPTPLESSRPKNFKGWGNFRGLAGIAGDSQKARDD